MNESIKQLLEDEIKSELEVFGDLELGSEEYKMAVDGLTKLFDRAIELEKIEVNSNDKSKDRDAERDWKIEQRIIDRDLEEERLRNEKTDRFANYLLAAAGIIIPSIITIWGTHKTLRFEQEGTVTTIMGRGFINKLLPKK